MNTLILIPLFTRHKLPERSHEGMMAEAEGLAMAIGLSIAATWIVKLVSPRPATLFGQGKLDETKAFITTEEVGLVIVDGKLSPVQQRNLEKQLNCKVIDRTALILEIFAERAQTAEGKLQVELAALNYQKSRLVRTWTHLERQRGGFGFLGGPGETQLEVDRRIIADRIKVIEKGLEKVVKTRTLHRSKRSRSETPSVALVGYTNAGKSTLFNLLTGAHVLAENKLFATLDPTIRKMKLPSGREAVLSDTVGFISNLPTELVAAFRATLEEVTEADLILHVRDISHPETEAQKKDVETVLKSLGLAEKMRDGMIEVLNKVDCLEEFRVQSSEFSEGAVAVSALKNTGIEKLMRMVERKLLPNQMKLRISVSCADGKTIAAIKKNCKILSEKMEDDVVHYHLLTDEHFAVWLATQRSI